MKLWTANRIELCGDDDAEVFLSLFTNQEDAESFAKYCDGYWELRGVEVDAEVPLLPVYQERYEKRQREEHHVKQMWYISLALGGIKQDYINQLDPEYRKTLVDQVAEMCGVEQ